MHFYHYFQFYWFNGILVGSFVDLGVLNTIGSGVGLGVRSDVGWGVLSRLIIGKVLILKLLRIFSLALGNRAMLFSKDLFSIAVLPLLIPLDQLSKPLVLYQHPLSTTFRPAYLLRNNS